MQDTGEYIQQMIKDGYWAEDLTPLKCRHCDSTNLVNKNHHYENLGCVEYEVWCKDCNKIVNIWSYGSWDV